MSFPRYPKYKASGVEWLGEVPEGWTVKPLRYVCSVRKGKLPGATFPNPTAETDLPYLSMEYLRGEFECVDYVAASQNIVCAESGDILLLWDGSNAGEFLRAKQGAVSSTVALIEPKNVAQQFLFFACKARERELKDQTIGMGIPHVSGDTLKSFAIPTPPLPEQTAIAEFLDRETGKIDELVAEQRRLMELLKEKIASLVLSSMDLPSTKRLRFGDAASIISRPVLQQEEESYTRIGLFNRARGLFHKDASEMDDMGESDFFWIEEGDLIISGQFAWEGAVAMAGKEDTGCVVSHRYPVLRGVPGIALTEYLFGLLCTDHGDFLLNENSRGAAGRNRPLNIRYLMKEKIPVPSMQIQEAVARAIHSRAALFQEISNTIDLLQERRTALISAAVTGQIDVRQHSPKN